MDKLKITEEDLSLPQASHQAITDTAPEGIADGDNPGATDNLPLRTRLALAPLIVLLPVLCLVTIVGRVAMSEKSTEARAAWLKYTGTLLVISSLLSCVAGVILYARIDRVPTAEQPGPESPVEATSRTLSKLSDLPQLDNQPIAADVAETRLKPLVFVVAQPDEPPVDVLDKLPKDKFGTASLLYVNATSALLVTSKYLVEPAGGTKAGYLYSPAGHAPAEVVARHNTLDLALLRIELRGQESLHVQPVRNATTLVNDETVYSLGHPDGQFYTFNSGTGTPADANNRVPLDWTVKPGSFGAPIYDSAGRLIALAAAQQQDQLGLSTSAINASVLLEINGWTFASGQRRYYDEYIANPKIRAPAQPN
jgi:hypothetical protein